MATIDIDLDFSGTIFDAGQGNLVRRTVLPGGVRVLTEAMPAQRSASIGFWVAVGSRDEAAHGHGSTHFLEHLLFKGTDRYTGTQISNAFDRVGGEFNAATAKEFTCYHARVLDQDLPMAIDILTSMVTAPTLSKEEMDIERGVILEELAMDAHDPSNVGHELLAARLLKDHPLGRPIGGTKQAIQDISHDHMVEHYQHWYRPEELVITVAGGVDHDQIVQWVSEALGHSAWDTSENARPVERRSTTGPDADIEEGFVFKELPAEQSAVFLGGKGINTHDESRFALSVMNVILGGGMSSRLFQEIRERRGLAYTTYAFSAGYSDVGYFGLYAGCSPRRTDEVLEFMGQELDKMAVSGITSDELDRAHGQISGSLVLGLEDTGSRMSRLGRAELVTGEYTDLDGALERIQKVTADEVQQIAQEFATSPRTLITVGPSAES